MTGSKTYDIIIIGGGISGSLACLNLLKENRTFKIAVLEQKTEFPQKIGESSSDITTLLLQGLGIDDLLEQQTQKAGLRFIFSDHNNEAEFASPVIKGTHIGYHLNRKTFDEDLLQEVRRKGVDVYRPIELKALKCETFKNKVVFHQQETECVLESKWLIDASGSARILVKALKWKDIPIDLHTGAIMTHFHNIPKNETWDFPESDYWIKKGACNRDYSTVHFMRKNSWWWFIRINANLVSIGLVYDKNKIKIEDPETYFDLHLEQDPQLSKVTLGAERGNIKYIKSLAYVPEQLYQKGQLIIGDSCAFIDPFLSPGIELICQQSAAIAKLLTNDYHHGSFNQKDWDKYNKRFIESYMSRVKIYKNSYQFMDNFDVFSSWLKLGNLAYLGLYIFPAIKVKSRLIRPFNLNKLEHLGLDFMIWRLQKAYKRRSQHKNSISKKAYRITFSGVQTPATIKFYLIPFVFFGKWIWSYIRLELATLFLALKKSK